MWSAAVRFAAAVIVTPGALLVADATITVAWQEPISALRARGAQQLLDRQLDAEATAVGEARASGERPSKRRVDLLATQHADRTRTGDAIGRVELPTLDRRYALVEGDDPASLRKGPGHYPDTPLPGQGGTVAIAGHRTTFLAPFRPIDELRPGDPIVVAMPYARFTYRVERTRIVPPTALWVKRRVRYERLILTACHPLYSAAQRIVVFARLDTNPPRRSLTGAAGVPVYGFPPSIFARSSRAAAVG
ncbi:MAG: class E sortase [Thermoleophilaceae bacterium]|nr:class E sortase [Thermoleophilaceae bacterium]